MKAFAPPATLVAAFFAAFAVIAAWKNLTETEKGSLVRVDVLRQRLIAIEKESAEFSTKATSLYKLFHDPSEDIQAWRSGSDPQLIQLTKVRSQLNEQFDYLIGRTLDIDTTDLAKTRAEYMSEF
jgi:hypothetical protein